MIARAAFALFVFVLATAPLTATAQEISSATQPRLEDHISRVLREHMMACWRMPVDTPDYARLTATVEFDLKQDGTLDGAPRVTSPRNYMFDRPMREAVEAAMRAVRICAPYPFANDPITADRYDAWDKLEMTFRAP